MSLICVVPWCKNGQQERRGDPRGRPGTWWGGESGHAHPPAPREFGLALLHQKGGSCRSRGNADIPSRTELPAPEIMTAVLPLCSLMRCNACAESVTRGSSSRGCREQEECSARSALPAVPLCPLPWRSCAGLLLGV